MQIALNSDRKASVRKRNPQVNAVVSPAIMEALVLRAQAAGATKSEYAALIIQQWFANGCPPVSESERRGGSAAVTEVKLT